MSSAVDGQRTTRRQRNARSQYGGTGRVYIRLESPSPETLPCWCSEVHGRCGCCVKLERDPLGRFGWGKSTYHARLPLLKGATTIPACRGI
jgi:hypothetical protein